MTIDRGSNSLRISFVGDNRNLSLLFFLGWWMMLCIRYIPCITINNVYSKWDFVIYFDDGR